METSGPGLTSGTVVRNSRGARKGSTSDQMLFTELRGPTRCFKKTRCTTEIWVMLERLTPSILFVFSGYNSFLYIPTRCMFRSFRNSMTGERARSRVQGVFPVSPPWLHRATTRPLSYKAAFKGERYDLWRESTVQLGRQDSLQTPRARTVFPPLTQSRRDPLQSSREASQPDGDGHSEILLRTRM